MRSRQGFWGEWLLFFLGIGLIPSWGLPILSLAEDGLNGFALDPQGPVEFVNADDVWNTYNFRGAGQRTAIIDTGLNPTDPALEGKIVASVNFADDEPDPAKLGHGTSVAKRVLAMAPQSELIDLRVIRNGDGGEWPWVRDAIAWVNANRTTYNITAINMSIGGGGKLSSVPTDTEILEVEAQLATFVANGGFVGAAAGNGYAPTSASDPNPANPADLGLLYPAISPNAVAVGSVWEQRVGDSEGYVEGKNSQGQVIWWAYTDPDRIHPQSQRIDPAVKMAYMLTPPGGATSFTSPYVTGASLLLREACQTWFPTRPVNQGALLYFMQHYGVPIRDAEAPMGQQHDSVANSGFTFSRLDVWASTVGIQSGPWPVPEASVVWLFGLGLLLLAWQWRRKRARVA